MRRRPAISIIVPVYNTADTLRRCFESIISQNFSDWECLIIDDGSTDASPAICDEYAVRDARFKVFHKKNGGVSSARNLGLKNICGEWVTFVDADDKLTKNAFDDSVIKSHADIIFNSYYYIQSDGRIARSEPLIEQNTDFLVFLEKNLDNPTFYVVWTKLFSSRIIQNLSFDEKMRIGEDTLFTLNCLNKCTTYSIIERPTYIYYAPNELTMKYSQDIKDSIVCLRKIFTAYKRLIIRNLKFETKLFSSYKALCQDSIYNDARAWYDNGFIKETYQQIKKGFSREYRLRYSIMSKPLVSKIICLITHRC